MFEQNICYEVGSVSLCERIGCKLATLGNSEFLGLLSDSLSIEVLGVLLINPHKAQVSANTLERAVVNLGFVESSRFVRRTPDQDWHTLSQSHLKSLSRFSVFWEVFTG